MNTSAKLLHINALVHRVERLAAVNTMISAGKLGPIVTELQAALDDLNLPADRIGKWEADNAQDDIGRHLAKIVTLATEAATKAELVELNKSAVIIMDAAERLSRGVVRPDLSPEQLKLGA
jgi:hypothetical protein